VTVLRTFALFLLLILALAACGPRTPAPPAATGAPPTTSEPTAAPTATASPTPSTDTAYREILAEVARLRGLPAPADLYIRFVARADLPALLDDLLTDEDRRWFAETTTLYRLLGHLRTDQNYLDIYRSFGATAVLGLYSPDHDTLWIVRDGYEAPDPADLTPDELETLAHEFVHAIQDARFDLGETYRRVVENLDRNLAWTAAVEGDAVYTSVLYRGRRGAWLPIGRTFALVRAELERGQTGDVPPSILRELYFPYTTGADWARAVVEGHGWAKLDSYLREPPLATSVILHPDLVASAWAPEAVPEPDPRAALASTWRRESGGQFGEFSLRNFLQLRLGAADAGAAAAGWSGDAYAVYTDGTSHLAVFEIRFEQQGDAEAAAAAVSLLLERSGGRTVEAGAVAVAVLPDGREFALLREARRVLLAIADAPGIARSALEAIAPR
jgi:predicted small lipoprotein YifL